MHWARWGDPAEAAPLPEAARGLVELAFGPAAEHPTTPLDEVRLPRAGARRRRCSPSCATCSATGTCTPTTRPGSGTPAASPPPTCCGCARATGPTPPTSSSGPPTTTRSPPSSPGAASTGSRWCRSAAARRSSAAWPCCARGTPAWSRSTWRRLDRLVSVDAESGTAVLQAGVLGPAAEALLAEHGLTLGHFPQSFEYASIGGFAATRSSGQASSGYGRFDALVVGPHGRHPARHPRARQRARQRRRPRPARAGARLRGCVRRDHLGHRAGPAGPGRQGVRRLAVRRRSPRARPPCGRSPSPARLPTVLRLSDENETAINLAQPDEVGGESRPAAA